MPSMMDKFLQMIGVKESAVTGSTADVAADSEQLREHGYSLDQPHGLDQGRDELRDRGYGLGEQHGSPDQTVTTDQAPPQDAFVAQPQAASPVEAPPQTPAEPTLHEQPQDILHDPAPVAEDTSTLEHPPLAGGSVEHPGDALPNETGDVHAPDLDHDSPLDITHAEPTTLLVLQPVDPGHLPDVADGATFDPMQDGPPLEHEINGHDGHDDIHTPDHNVDLDHDAHSVDVDHHLP